MQQTLSKAAATVPVIDLTAVLNAAFPPSTASSSSRPVDVRDGESALRFDLLDAALREATADTNGRGSGANAVGQTVAQLQTACEKVGFFYVTGYSKRHAEVEAALDAAAREFFSLPLAEKSKISMDKGGRAWRGYFPVGNELTSGKPDLKEGIYFGLELDESAPRVAAGVPLHGRNLFPDIPPQMGALVIEYMDHCSRLGHLLMALIACGLGLPADYFAKTIVKDHLPLFRAFHYPPKSQLSAELRREADGLWGVGEHTDYGLLTLLKQDTVGGLEVRALDGHTWLPVPPLPGTLVVNLGDVLESITHGLLRSTPHRVRNPSADAMRVSLPFFFDPGFNAAVTPVPLDPERAERARQVRTARAAAGFRRWDEVNEPATANKSYGEYLVGKVSKVFPQLAYAKL